MTWSYTGYHERRWIPGTCLEVHSAVAPGCNHCERLHTLSLRHTLHPQKGANTIESVTNWTQTRPSCVCYMVVMQQACCFFCPTKYTALRRSSRSDSQTIHCVHGSSAVVVEWLKSSSRTPTSAKKIQKADLDLWPEFWSKWMMKVLVTLWVVAGILTSSIAWFTCCVQWRETRLH